LPLPLLVIADSTHNPLRTGFPCLHMKSHVFYVRELVR
jgi:hypothetical protein